MQTGAPSARATLREAAERLERAGVPEARASAEVLLSELLGVRRGELSLREEPITAEQASVYAAWISRRANREPVQRILGYAYFRNLKLDLNEHTLIPRPDTESVVDAALEAVDLRGGRCTVLDIGTGSGAIAISIAQERPGCEVHATDISAQALEVAVRNAERNAAEVRFHRADVAAGLELPDGGVDVLVSNPPYVAAEQAERLAPEVREWDPDLALYAGTDGLCFFRRIFAETPPLLRNGSDVVLEIGDGQAGVVLGLGEDAGFVPLGTRQDLAGTERAVLLRWPG
jgi:release factor glutamine methyltransferase